MSTKKASIANRAFVDFSEKAAPSPSHAVEKRIQTGPGLMTSFLAKDSEAMRENEELRKEVQKWDGAILTRKIDPRLIDASRWANRHESSFVGFEFDEFKDEIGKAGGNVQPIKVRPLPVSGEEPQRYEIVFGHRRHRACLELGLDVLAIIESLTNEALFIEMDRENRQRKDLRPYEQGLMYQRALDAGLFSSARKMAEAIGVDVGNLSKATSIAKLPSDILNAFSSPLDVQLTWGSVLNQAIQKDPEIVLARAKELCLLEPRLQAKKVLDHLLEGGVVSNNTPLPVGLVKLNLNGKSGETGSINLDRNKRTLAVNLKNIDVTVANEIQLFIQKRIGDKA